MKNLIILTLVFTLNSSAFGMADGNPKKAKPAFDSIQTLFQRMQAYQQLKIVVNFDSLTINRRKNSEHRAQLTLSGQGQPTVQLNTKVRPRGKFRRIRCDLPPMCLNFEKSALKEMNLYQKYDKLKLVTYCNADETSANYTLKEFWTYKLFNEVTDSSFRVHLLAITLVDEADTTKTIKSHAFVIENADEMAHRLNGELVEGIGTQPDALIPNSYQDVLMFNYMIGNTDWQLKYQKNLKLVKHKDSDLYTIVPYDFDFAKLVNPPYLRIDTKIPNLDENNRAAMDSFTDEADLQRCLDKFQQLRTTGFTCYQQCDKLSKKEKAEMTAFIKSFYKKIRQKNKLVSAFLAP